MDNYRLYQLIISIDDSNVSLEGSELFTHTFPEETDNYTIKNWILSIFLEYGIVKLEHLEARPWENYQLMSLSELKEAFNLWDLALYSTDLRIKEGKPSITVTYQKYI